MIKSDVSTLIAYNKWANERILAACERLSANEFLRSITPNPGWGSLRGILVHALDAEYGWRSVLQSNDASEILDESGFPDVSVLKARWSEEHAAWSAYLAGLNDESLAGRHGAENSLKVWQVIVHVTNHGTQHRSEAATILTGYGRSPGELDFDTFLKEHPEYL
jgi:uncharacterized damage-inducible protein DinB